MTKSVKYADLARLAGVSVATVSRALNNSSDVNAQTKQRIWQIAQDEGYAFRPNMPVSIKEAARIVSVIRPSAPDGSSLAFDPVISRLMVSIAKASARAGADVVLHHASPRNADELEEALVGTRAAGTIVLGQAHLHGALNRIARARGTEPGVPFVVWGAELKDQAYPSIGSDDREGGRMATRHLARLGRRRIAFLGDADSPSVLQRQDGYVQALEEAGLGFDPSLVIPVSTDAAHAETLMDAILARGMDVDAIFAGSDTIALGAILSLDRNGRRVPADVAVVGYGDLESARYARSALSTVPLDLERAGELLVRKVLSARRTTDIVPERLATKLIVRESCGG